MSLIAGTAIGVAAGIAAAVIPRKIFSNDKKRPPHLYEFFADNFWFDTVDLYDQKFNAPLKGKQKADIIIVGGGFTGMATAFHLIQGYPNRRIVLLEGACCGYGASGRNGGHALVGMHGLQDICKKQTPEKARELYDATLFGFNQIKELVNKHGVDCDLEESGRMVFASEEKHIPVLDSYRKTFKDMGLSSELIDTKSGAQKFIKSERFVAAWKAYQGGHLNPAKLARGMKDLIEKMGVEIFERSRVLKITPNKSVSVLTEFGEVEAPVAVLALNAYAPHNGFFKNKIISISSNIAATEPLSEKQLESIGWSGREPFSDMRATDLCYVTISADNRIIWGGEGLKYFYDDGIHTGTYRPIAEKIKESLLTTFPQLKGIKFTHEWGGTMSLTLDMLPSVGVMGKNKNIFYAGGYSGEGVVLSQLAGKILCDLISGEQNDYTRLPFVNKKIPPGGMEPFRFGGLLAYLAYMNRFGVNVSL